MIIKVLKASGEYELYDEQKVRKSLQRAGANNNLIKEIINSLQPKLYDGIPTEKIYRYVFKTLEELKSPVQSKYNLKRAIMALGPSGYPFEKFVAGIFQAYGYQTTVNQIVNGKCIDHEIDVILGKNNQRYMIECKFHNQPGSKTDSKVALYVYARFLDVKDNGFNQAWLITNTKLTNAAIKYCQCSNIKVVSWDYPADFSLRFLIEKSGLHPITCLNCLTGAEKAVLLENGVIFCHDLTDKKIGVLPKNRLTAIRSEVLRIYQKKNFR